MNILNVEQGVREENVLPYRNEDTGQALDEKVTLLKVKQLFMNDYSINDIVAQVLKEAQALYRQMLEKNATITLLCFEFSKADTPKIIQFIIHLPHVQFIVHHYSGNKIIFVLKTTDRMDLLKAFYKSTISVELIDEVQSSNENRRFPDVYSKFVNKLMNEKS